MRRLPVYLLLDVSGSMFGDAIGAVENGVQTLHSALMSDPHALETAYLSVITFSDSAQQVVPLTELSQFIPPQLEAKGLTSLGAALKFTAECADREVVKGSSKETSDWKPLVYIMTDGAATDNIDEGLAEFKKRKWGVVVACAAGADADPDELKKITEVVVKLNTADSTTLKAFFKWVTASISRSSEKIERGGGEPGKLDMLPDPPQEIEIL